VTRNPRRRASGARYWLTSLLFALVSVIVAVTSNALGVSNRVFLAIIAATLLALIPIAIQVDAVGAIREGLREGVKDLKWSSYAANADARIKAESGPLFQAVAISQLAAAERILEDLASGEATYSYGYEGDVIRSSIGYARRSIRATHDCRDALRRELWLTDTQQRQYLDAQAEVAQGRGGKKVSVQRILVLPRKTELTRLVLDSLAEIAERQLEIGLDVRAVCFDELPAAWEEDYVLVDSTVAHRYRFGVRTPYEGISIIVDTEAIAAIEERYVRLLSLARPWSELAPLLAKSVAPTSFYETDVALYESLAFGGSVPPKVGAFLEAERETVEWVLSQLPGQRKVLFDFGCGSGWYIRQALLGECANEFEMLTGIEVSEPMATAAAANLAASSRVAVHHGDALGFSDPVGQGLIPIGICTYNTLGVVADPQRFARRMMEQCRGGLLLISGFRGDRFASDAFAVYGEWRTFVGHPSFASVDEDKLIYSNASTGFRSRWYRLNEVVEILAAGGASLGPVLTIERGLGYYIICDVGAGLIKRSAQVRVEEHTG
jgi:hypothetical protein